MSGPQDPELQPLYCAWAEHVSERSGITEVRFDNEFDHGWSEYTPGVGEQILVQARFHNGSTWRELKSYTASYELPELVASIARFSQTWEPDS